MSDALSGIMSMGGPGGGGGGLSSILGPGLGLMSLLGNISANQARNNVLTQQQNLTKKYADLTPAQITAGISGLEQPLSSGLTTSVGNLVSGNLAERGLSQSPGIQTEALAQALGPYQLQEQQLATDAYFKQLGLPISARPSPFGPFPQTSNMSQLFQSMFGNMYGINPAGGNYPSVGGIPGYGPGGTPGMMPGALGVAGYGGAGYNPISNIPGYNGGTPPIVPDMSGGGTPDLTSLLSMFGTGGSLP